MIQTSKRSYIQTILGMIYFAFVPLAFTIGWQLWNRGCSRDIVFMICFRNVRGLRKIILLSIESEFGFVSLTGSVMWSDVGFLKEFYYMVDYGRSVYGGDTHTQTNLRWWPWFQIKDGLSTCTVEQSFDTLGIITSILKRTITMKV